MKKNRFYLHYSMVIFLFLASCRGTQPEVTETRKYVASTQVVHPDWTESAVIYEANIRQHTAEGTFKAFTEDLPRIKDMGVDIIWLMPVFPIGELNRKASQSVLVEEIEDISERSRILGSYYSIRDYITVNPEFGTLHDFRELITEIHSLNMYVILDIAVNHTAWDHKWITEHPDYYTRIDSDSLPWNPQWMAEHPAYYERIRNLGMTYPVDPNETDWWDVADLNFNNRRLRNELKEVFKYWVSELDVDGYRCDVAGWVPCDFWDEIRAALDSIKPVFMLAEDESNYCLMEKAFDMNYGWELHHVMNSIAREENTVNALQDYYNRMDSIFNPAIFRMNFITNHDENSWNGTEFERFGEAVEVFAMLMFTLPGMPLLYTGQEIGMNKRLKFFEKDTAESGDGKWEQFYTSMIEMKKEHNVFWNGEAGSSFRIIPVADSTGVFAFERSNDDETFVILANLGPEKVEVMLDESFADRQFFDIFSEDEVIFSKSVKLKGYEYKVLSEDF